MSSQLQTYRGNAVDFDTNWLEQKILELADACNIRVRMVLECDKAIATGALALAGGLLGGLVGGRMGAALGASIGGFTNFGLSIPVEFSLRDIWGLYKEKLKELFYIVFEYLRSLDVDYKRAFFILMECSGSKRELVSAILDFIAVEIGKRVIVKITATIENESICSHSNELSQF